MVCLSRGLANDPSDPGHAGRATSCYSSLITEMAGACEAAAPLAELLPSNLLIGPIRKKVILFAGLADYVARLCEVVHDT